MKIAPSILTCDFSKLGINLINASEAGADFIHLDVMDGIFVPNITFGPCVIKSIRKCTNIPFDVHLMIKEPLKYIRQFAEAGADIITFHLESESDIKYTIDAIKSFGKKPSLAIKPGTDIEAVFPYLDDLYMVLVMTVEPGFGGQAFMPDMMKKIKILKEEIKSRHLNVLVEVDGGINSDTIVIAKESGTDICVAGSSVFNDKMSVSRGIKELLDACE